MSKKHKYKSVTGRTSSYKIYKSEKHGVITYDESEVIWAEKFRPRLVDDLILTDEIISQVEEYINTNEVPNILLYSSDGGSGKDSIIQVIYNNTEIDMLTINASLHRDINTIRTTVVEFISLLSMEGNRKVIYLNEVGGLTKVALDSLKGLIEEHSKNASFFLTTNSMENISHPLQSRFEFFDLDTIPKDDRKDLIRKLYKRVCAILEFEEIEYEAATVKYILKSYFPKYRDIITNLKKSIVDGVLEYTILDDSELQSTYNKILKAIVDGNQTALVKLSEEIEPRHFVSWLSRNLLDVVNEDMLGDIVLELNTLQTELLARPPFPALSLLAFFYNCVGLDNPFIVKGK